jgi:sorbitol/mannitol transport system permease protein
VLKPVREGLSYNNELYALPFYAESSMTYYRKDLVQKAGMTMPEQPTYQQIKDLAAKIYDPANQVMLLTGFKTEVEAISTPPKLFFTPTLENYYAVFERSDYMSFAINSIVISVVARALAILIAVPAAYVMAFFPTERTRGTLLWMLSTKMMPPVGVLVPMYLLFRDFGLLDTRTGLIIIYTLMNLPIVIWMLYTFFKEVPGEILEAGRMDGARARQEVTELLLPLALPGIASTALLSIILCWNEAFWGLNLSAHNAAPLTAFIASFSSPEGLFWAKLSAASTLAIAPILVFGWMSQRQLGGCARSPKRPTSSTSARCWNVGPRNFPVVSASALPSAAPSSVSPRSSCSTNPCPTSTPPFACRCGSSLQSYTKSWPPP